MIELAFPLLSLLVFLQIELQITGPNFRSCMDYYYQFISFLFAASSNSDNSNLNENDLKSRYLQSVVRFVSLIVLTYFIMKINMFLTFPLCLKLIGHEM